MSAKMPELKRCFETAGFRNVKTVLSSGNVVFDATSSSGSSIERQAEAAMQQVLGRTFLTIIRSVVELRILLETDPYAEFSVSPNAKRVVSFLRDPPVTVPSLPVELDGARILRVVGREVFTAYVRSASGPVFMKLLEQAFGAEITTRTWETVKKCVCA
jgi:uncharacterized protein (DUF1697 family)